MIKVLTFNKDSHFTELKSKKFAATIFLTGAIEADSGVLVTLASHDNLPPVRDYYAALLSFPGEGGGTQFAVECHVRFVKNALQNGKLKGTLGINIFVKGATDYIPFPPLGG